MAGVASGPQFAFCQASIVMLGEVLHPTLHSLGPSRFIPLAALRGMVLTVTEILP